MLEPSELASQRARRRNRQSDFRRLPSKSSVTRPLRKVSLDAHGGTAWPRIPEGPNQLFHPGLGPACHNPLRSSHNKESMAEAQHAFATEKEGERNGD